jgi:hypothetical protein
MSRVRILEKVIILHHQLPGFYNGDAVCLLRGTDQIFLDNSG